MKSIVSLKTCLAAVRSKCIPLAAIGLLGFGSSAQAVLTFSLTQVGSDVVLTGSGTADTGALSYASDGGSNEGIYPNGGVMFVGDPAPSGENYTGAGETDFGFETDGWVMPDSTSGDNFGFSGIYLQVPFFYSGEILSGSATWANTTISTLGATPGTYTWMAGATPIANLTVVPEPSTWALSAGVLALGAMIVQRKLRGRKQA